MDPPAVPIAVSLNGSGLGGGQVGGDGLREFPVAVKGVRHGNNEVAVAPLNDADFGSLQRLQLTVRPIKQG